MTSCEPGGPTLLVCGARNQIGCVSGSMGRLRDLQENLEAMESELDLQCRTGQGKEPLSCTDLHQLRAPDHLLA